MPLRLPEAVYLERYRSENYEVVAGLPICSSKTRVTLLCPRGHSYSSTPTKWALGRRCQKCSTPRGFDRHDWASLLSETIKDGYRVEYVGRAKDRRIVGTCPHGHSVEAPARALLRKGVNICSLCATLSRALGEKRRTGLELSQKLELEGYKVLSQYEGQHSPLTVECTRGHEYTVNAMGLTQGNRCKRCGNTGISSAQHEIYEYIKSILPTEEVLLSDRSTIKNPKTGYFLELDIYVPSRKFALEYDGLYWHSSANPDFVRGRQRVKALQCRKLGIKYFGIFEDEWNNKKDLVCAMIRWRLGLFSGKRIMARKLKLRQLKKNKEFKEFFERNHLDGHVNASFAYGLFLEDKLVSCASFRTNHQKEFECARLATDYSYGISGAVGRLFSAVKGTLVSFSNNRLSSGDIYQKLGFEGGEDTTSPSYYYTDGKKRVWRFKCARINDPEVLARYPEVPHTEIGQALGGLFSAKLFGDRRPLYRIEDCGHRKWVRRQSIPHETRQESKK